MKLHKTFGIYPNGDWVSNAVHPNDLESHIEYNRTMRPGRALVVDGILVLKGIGVNPETIENLKGIFNAYNPTKCSAPYR